MSFLLDTYWVEFEQPEGPMNSDMEKNYTAHIIAEDRINGYNPDEVILVNLKSGIITTVSIRIEVQVVTHTELILL